VHPQCFRSFTFSFIRSERFTRRGKQRLLLREFVNSFFRDLSSAKLFAKTMIDDGEWKTWDAFCLSQRASVGRRLVASHGGAVDAESPR
jgi:hypothetical protein